MIAPNVFDLDDSGAGKVIADPVSESDLDEVREAVISCPENAITLSE